jgi:hypothetical protein
MWSFMTLNDWAQRWGLPAQALTELACIPAFVPVEFDRPLTSESATQACVRLEAARNGVHLWRNNNGAGKLENGQFLRWGLANDSPQLNKVLKSADLIGWRKRVITLDDVGKPIAQFVSRECKRPGWKYTGTPDEQAQVRWHSMILAAGGDSAIVNSEGSIK